MVSILISSLTSLRKRAQDALQRSNEELEQRVQRRTSELRGSNERLRDSEERFRAMVEGVKDYAIIMLNADGRVVSWNAGAERIEGYTQEEAHGQDVSRFFPSEEAAIGEPAKHLGLAARDGRHEDEGWRVRKDGSRLWANVITTALRDDSGTLRGFAQITRDITELRKLEREVLHIAEAEQRRIGHDLHDGLGQELTGLALLSQSLADRMASAGVPEASEVRRLASLIMDALEQTRDLARGFSPVELGTDGLRAGLQNLAAKIQLTSGLPCALSCPGKVAVDDEAALHLYRIAQEALSNAVRHGRSTELALSLTQTVESVTLMIRDNGVGFRPEGGRGNGMGVSVMRYRASMIGAKLEIGSVDTRGVVVSCVYAAQRSPASPVGPALSMLTNSSELERDTASQKTELDARQSSVANSVGG